jgi:hypothetical protein
VQKNAIKRRAIFNRFNAAFYEQPDYHRDEPCGGDSPQQMTFDFIAR